MRPWHSPVRGQARCCSLLSFICYRRPCLGSSAWRCLRSAVSRGRDTGLGWPQPPAIPGATIVWMVRRPHGPSRTSAAGPGAVAARAGSASCRWQWIAHRRQPLEDHQAHAVVLARQLRQRVTLSQLGCWTLAGVGGCRRAGSREAQTNRARTLQRPGPARRNMPSCRQAFRKCLSGCPACADRRGRTRLRRND